MRRFLVRFVGRGQILVLAILLAGCSGFGGSAAPQSTSNIVGHNTPTIQSNPTKVVSISSATDTLAAQVLMNMHLHAWNPAAMTRGVVTGGLFINWEMNDPARTNAVRPGPDGNPLHNHDPQVDLLYLMAQAEYHQIHPGDHTFDTDLDHITTLVLADFRSYSLPKGWIYFYLLRSGLMLHNSQLIDEAHAVAINFYNHWYDSQLGAVYDRAHTPGDYSTNHSLQCGAALIDAGQRWNQPEWISAGENAIEHVISAGLDPNYHLFYNSMIISNSGRDEVQNYQAKPSTQGEAVDALVTAYTLVHRQQYLDVAGQVLQSLLVTSGLWDKDHGGFSFALDMSSGKLFTNYKETRSQTLSLIGLNNYNQVGKRQFASQEQQLISVIINHFYEGTYHGFFYRVTPDFHVYMSRPGAGIGVENYFTTEAMGSALDALQRTELS